MQFDAPISTVNFRNSRLKSMAINSDVFNIDFTGSSGDVTFKGNLRTVWFSRTALQIQVNGELNKVDFTDSTSKVIINGDIQDSRAFDFKGEMEVNGDLNNFSLVGGDGAWTELTVMERFKLAVCTI